MLNFVPGDVLESRRGGVDVLRHLAQELAILERNGSIQIRRNIPEVGERIGHLLIFDGSLAAAFHQAEVLRFGIEALLEIESDASALDATMSLHELTEASYIEVVSTNANMSLLNPDENHRDEAWWTTVRTPVRRLEREERLPELKPSVGVPEALRRRSEARLRMQSGPVLQRGQTWLEHAIDPVHAFTFARTISELDHPILIISRQSPLQMESNYDIDLKHYRWLSETQHERTLEPSLETIRRTVDEFADAHQNNILVIEGIEYLSGIHGEQRVIEMIRSIVDQTRINGNVLIITSNLEAFSRQQRSRLEREFTGLESDQIQTWLLDIELLQEHPFFMVSDAEAEAAIMQHLQENVSDPILTPKLEIPTPVQQIPLPVEHRTQQVDDELRSKMRAWVNDSDEEDSSEIPEIEQEQIVEIVENKPIVRPRIPQRMVRRRKNVTKPVQRTAIDVAAQRNIALPSLEDSPSTKPFVPVRPTKEHAFPEQQPTMTHKRIQQAASTSTRKKSAKFPPIKATGRVPLPSTSEQQPPSSNKPSSHAREHAHSSQRRTDEHDSEGEQ
ncbi:MAG: DUF835 domain-containing protein [Candidatus Poseidoniaceae archaeon]